MKIKFLSLTLVLLLLLCILSSCGCEHEWKDADCTTPKTCTLCQATEGEPKGHSWQDATCTAPKTCKDCKETEGEAKPHSWLDATCTQPKVCKNCDAKEGKALGHKWIEATTEAPTTCERCKVTEGKKIDTDPRFTTKSTKELYGKWKCEVTFPAEIFQLQDYLKDIPCTLTYVFNNDGTLKANLELHDNFAFLDAFKKFTKDTLVKSLMSQGIAESQIDEAMMATYGMTVDEYIDTYIESIDLDTLFSMFNSDMVYYVGQNGLYTADSWMGEFEVSEYKIEKDTLIIEEDRLDDESEPFVWKKVKEKN